MRRYFTGCAALICSCLCCLGLLCGCAGQQTFDEKEFMIREGVNLLCEMDAMAENENFLALYSSSDAIKNLTSEIGGQDYRTPKSVYLLEPPPALLKATLQIASGEREVTDNVLAFVTQKINAGTFVNIINSRKGADMIAATAILSFGKSYIWAGPKETRDKNWLLLLEYEGGYSGAVSFMTTGEGVKSSYACFLANNAGGLRFSDLFDPLQSFTELTYDSFTGEELSGLLAE